MMRFSKLLKLHQTEGRISNNCNASLRIGIYIARIFISLLRNLHF